MALEKWDESSAGDENRTERKREEKEAQSTPEGEAPADSANLHIDDEYRGVTPLVDREFLRKLVSGKIEIEELFTICKESIQVLSEEPSVLKISSDVLVVGDIHGQFFDLLNVLKVPHSAQYLFLGDYVDRGVNSLEVILLLLHMKIRNREKVWMIRGNHESRRLSYEYGFFAECVGTYQTSAVWEALCEVFDYLPLAAVIDETTLAVHGGIGPQVSLGSLIRSNRVEEVDLNGVMSEIMWSDPKEAAKEYEKSARGSGYLFGEAQVDRFFSETGFTRIIRSHQLVDEGYREDFGGKVVTIWSAPNYCYRCMNRAGVLKVSCGTLEYIEIEKAEEQKRKPLPSIYFM